MFLIIQTRIIIAIVFYIPSISLENKKRLSFEGEPF